MNAIDNTGRRAGKPRVQEMHERAVRSKGMTLISPKRHIVKKNRKPSRAR